jgi:hypothetical protein
MVFIRRRFAYGFEGMKRLGSSWLLLGTVLALGGTAQSAVTRTLDGTQVLVTKTLGDHLWAVTRNQNGTVTGIAVDRSSGEPEFFWCQQTWGDGSEVGLTCFSRDTCQGPSCDSVWVFLGDVVLPSSFFLAQPAPTPAPQPPTELGTLLGGWSFTPLGEQFCFRRVVGMTIEVEGDPDAPFLLAYDPWTIFGGHFDYRMSEPDPVVAGQHREFLFNRWSEDSVGGIYFRWAESLRLPPPFGTYPDPALVDHPAPFVASRLTRGFSCAPRR